jgi:hypothetical protein
VLSSLTAAFVFEDMPTQHEGYWGEGFLVFGCFEK